VENAAVLCKNHCERVTQILTSPSEEEEEEESMWDLTHFVLCHQYTFYIAHMETEQESHYWTLGSYV